MVLLFTSLYAKQGGNHGIKFFISERQSRQKELQELERKLTASQRDLREEELKMKHQVICETSLNPRPPRHLMSFSI